MELWRGSPFRLMTLASGPVIRTITLFDRDNINLSLFGNFCQYLPTLVFCIVKEVTS